MVRMQTDAVYAWYDVYRLRVHRGCRWVKSGHCLGDDDSPRPPQGCPREHRVGSPSLGHLNSIDGPVMEDAVEVVSVGLMIVCRVHFGLANVSSQLGWVAAFLISGERAVVVVVVAV